MAHNVSNLFPLPVDYFTDNTATLLTNGITQWRDYNLELTTVSEKAVYDEHGDLLSCAICMDVLDPAQPADQFRSIQAWHRVHHLVKNRLYQHIFYVACFSGLMEAGTPCPVCRQRFVDTKEEVSKYGFVPYALHKMATGDYHQVYGLTELPIRIDAHSLVGCLLPAAHHLRIKGSGAPSAYDEAQHAPDGVADHADGRRVVECLLEAACKRDNHYVKIDAFVEQLPTRAVTILRQQHPGVAYTHGMWRFCGDVARLGLMCYAEKHNMRDQNGILSAAG